MTEDDQIDAMLDALRAKRDRALREPPPIPCKLIVVGNPIDGTDYDCEYEHAGKIDCGDCIVNGGSMDPRTGKRFRLRRGRL